MEIIEKTNESLAPDARLSHFSCTINFMINFLRWILRRVINLIADVKITGLENIPTTGAFVIATNHLGLSGLADVVLLP